MKLIPVDKLKHVMAVRTDALGDMLSIYPALYLLKQKYPHLKITVLGCRYNLDVIKTAPFIDQFLAIEDVFPDNYTQKNRIQFFKDQQVDAVIHYIIRPELIWSSFLAKVPYIVGDTNHLSLLPAFWKYGTKLPNSDFSVHSADLSTDLLKSFGISRSQTKVPPAPIPEQALAVAKAKHDNPQRRPGVPLIGIHPGSRAGNKPIEANKYADFIRDIRKHRDVDICLTGHGDAEVAKCQSIIDEIKDNIYLVTGISLTELQGVITFYDLYISIDTGPFHIAAAHGIPILAVFATKKIKPGRWAPWFSPHYIVRDFYTCPHKCPPPPGDPCPYTICSDNIKTQDMVQKALALLDGKGLRNRAEQDAYWFKSSYQFLFLYDKATQGQAEELAKQLQGWGYYARTHALADRDSLETQCIHQDFGIIQNLSNQKKLSLFKQILEIGKAIHIPPLLVHGVPSFSSDLDVFTYYKAAIRKRWY